MKKLFKLIFNRWTLIVFGLIALSLLIWWVAPAIQIFEHAPLAPEWVRWTLIALVCGLVIGKALWKVIRAKRAGAALAAGLAQPTPGSPSDPRDEEGTVLADRFNSAMEVLKKTSLGKAKRSPLARLSSLLTGSYLYDLPWYVFIGAPGSGKTTALLNSGLQFPLAERFGKDGIHGVGGTRNCDWFFTDEAILLDTAGRYTTQESNQDVDASGWRSFMQLLKKSRPRRPINGVLLTVSAEDLLQQSGVKREEHAAALRRRLKELYSDLGIRFPVYVLVSKVDLLAGFNEFFATLGKEEREQVWGFSLPYSEQATGLEDVSKQLELLERQLYARLTTRMREDPDAQKRALIYAFPQQFAIASRRLNELLGRVFAPSKYDVAPLLRGAYFTSGTQEGSPIDRISGQLARSFGLERKLLPPQRASGRSYFLTRLLKDLVFAERGLAGTNLKWERRRAFIELGVAACGVAIVALASLAWFISYRHNLAYLDAVTARLGEVKQQVETIPAGATTEVLSLLPTLDSVLSLSQTRATADGSVPWSYKFGLYQGGKLEAASEHAYQRLLQATFLPALVGRLEGQLHTGFTGNSDLTYEALKSYIMLNEHKHFDLSDVRAWFTLDWEAMMSREVTNEQRAELHEHLTALYRDGWVQPPSLPDEELKTQVRRNIGSTPLAQRIYARLRRLDVAKDARDFAISPRIEGAELVFARTSREPLTKGIPGLYTFDGYHKSFAKEAERAAKRLAAEEQWVMARNERSDIANFLTSQASAVYDSVRRLYLDDYREQWTAYIKDLTIAPKRNLEEKIQLAQMLSDPTPNNPLKRLFTALARETTLADKPKEEKDLLDKAEDKTRSTLNDLTKLVPGMAGRQTGGAQSVPLEKTLVDDYFRNVRDFAVAPAAGQPAPIDGAVALMNEIYAMLIVQKRAQAEKVMPPPSPTPDKAKAEAARYPEPLRSMVSALASGSAGDIGPSIIAMLDQDLRAQVTDFCVKAITQRYPFVPTNRDVTQEDFVSLFGPGGKLDSFYQQKLAQLVDPSGARWHFKQYQGTPLPTGPDLDEFRKAQVIREVFFPAGSRAPSLRFEFKPVEMDATIQQFTLDVDGQLLKYAHGPQVPMTVQFPGPKGSTQVRVSISPPTQSGNSGFVLEGPWALFRLFQNVRIENTGQSERFRATIAVEDRKAVFEVSASSVQNPFRLKEIAEFHCPQSL